MALLEGPPSGDVSTRPPGDRSLEHARPSDLKQDLAAVAFLATKAVGLFSKWSG